MADPAWIDVSTLRPGDILLSRGFGDISDMICASDGGRYSHAALWTGESVIHATLSGVKADGLLASHGPQQYVDVYRFSRNGEQPLGSDPWPAAPVIARAQSFVGGPYAYTDLMMLALLLGFARRRRIPALDSIVRRLSAQLADGAAAWLETRRHEARAAAGHPPEATSPLEAKTCTELVGTAFYEAESDPTHAYGLEVVLPGRDAGVKVLSADPELDPTYDDLEAACRALVRQEFPELERAQKTREDERVQASVQTLGWTSSRRVIAGERALPLSSLTPRDLEMSPSLRCIGRLSQLTPIQPVIRAPSRATGDPISFAPQRGDAADSFAPLLVEIHKLFLGGTFVEGSPYVLTEGRFKQARPFTMPMAQPEFLRVLRKLRYPGSSQGDPEARERVGTLARDILKLNLPEGSHPIQIDLVSNAEELWAVPFEACLDAKGAPLFQSERQIVLTRRIRTGFAAHMRRWPAQPRVLFVTAGPASDTGELTIEPKLVAEHRAALEAALAPWIQPWRGIGRRKGAERFLHILEDPSIGEIATVCAAAWPDDPFTHIHVLAHGVQIKADEPGESVWGVRIGGANISPDAFVQAIAPTEGLPAVVTIAACDSANATDPFTPEKSFAQELHRAGVPVVVASQLPLTVPGSTTLVRHFYARVLQGEDVRRALYETFVALHADPNAGHDWLSVVAYVQLPEGYDDQRVAAALRSDLALLEAADAAAAELGKGDVAHPEPTRAIAQELRECSAVLERRCAEIQELRLGAEYLAEAYGLLGSAHKRLAQLLFECSVREPGATLVQESLEALQQARAHYQRASSKNPSAHWVAAQSLALTAILDGKIEDPIEWEIQRRNAAGEAESSADEIWAWGTLAELYLLARLGGGQPRIKDALAALKELENRAQAKNADFPIRSTRRQLLRYLRWWTRPNGFFAKGAGDLAADAQFLLQELGWAEDMREPPAGAAGAGS